MRRLNYLRSGLANTSIDKAALLKTIQPTLSELVSVLDNQSPIYRELKALVAKDGGRAQAILENLESKPLPAGLRASLLSLAEKAATSLAASANNTARTVIKNASEAPVEQLEVQFTELEGDVKALGQEIEGWFDRGMERAAGVYRRNSKAVGIILGITIAISFNADSLHIIDRLSRDPTLRAAISQAAEQSAAADQSDVAIAELEDQVDSLLTDLSIPIGYSQATVDKQEAAEATWFVPLVPRRVVGWLISGIAISMGANFWFGLLKRVVDVKNSGKNSSNN